MKHLFQEQLASSPELVFFYGEVEGMPLQVYRAAASNVDALSKSWEVSAIPGTKTMPRLVRKVSSPEEV